MTSVEKPAAVVIRMPRELHEAIKAKVAGEERSAAQMIRHALRLYVGAVDPYEDANLDALADEIAYGLQRPPEAVKRALRGSVRRPMTCLEKP